MLLLLFPVPPSEGQEPQLEEAPKLVLVTKLPHLLDEKSLAGDFDGHSKGFIPMPMDLSHLTGQRMPGKQVPPPDESEPNISPPDVSQHPSSFDWRDEGKVTSVKDQGDCGSCYAFAAIANFESKMLIDGHAALPDLDLSENNAKECNYHETSCSGGNYFKMANWLSQKGTVLELCDPYVDSDVPCKGTCPYQETLLDWRIICGNVIPHTDVLKAYIHTYGPVYTSMYASFKGFSSYNGTYTLYYEGPEFPDHAVLIVGWDDTLSHDGGTGGWIVKNSWGTSWGDGGYFTIAYGSASIGKYSSFLYDWQDYDEHGDLYYYDEFGWMTALGQDDGLNKTAWGLCKFTPTDNAPIERVEFWTTDITTDVDIYIYDDFDGANLSNQLASKLDCSFSEAGYHSVVLDTPVPLSTGDDVTAVVKFTNLSSGYPIAADDTGPYETGRTYISLEGLNGPWHDLGTDLDHIGYFDACIRLRTPTMPIIVATDDADNVTTDSAILNGSLNSLGDYSSANVSFEWGTTSGALDQETIPATMTSTGAFSANLSSLAPSTTYYFRAKAASNPTFYGDELSLKTLNVLELIEIAPDSPTIALGRTQQFIAIGTYSDNSTEDLTIAVAWTSSNTSVATIGLNTGLAQSLAEGQTMITATLGQISNNSTLTVGPKVLEVIEIAPNNPKIALGRTQQFNATGTYSDNSTGDITNTVAWTSGNTSVATIGLNTGLAQSLAEGQTTISAASGNVSDTTILSIASKVLDAIAVTPPSPTIDAGRTQQFTATGTYSDNTTLDITDNVTWSSSNTTVARINAAGLATSYAEGTTVITATLDEISDNVTLRVLPKVIDSIAVTPENVSITSGQTQQFSATGTYSDGTSEDVTDNAIWASSNVTKAIINFAFGTDVSDFAIADDDTTIYAVDTESDKIYKSTNAGLSWVDISNAMGLSISSAQFVACAPDDPKLVFVADGTSPTGYFSDDGGTSWVDLGMPTDASTITDIDVSTLNSGNRYVAVSGNETSGDGNVWYYELYTGGSWMSGNELNGFNSDYPWSGHHGTVTNCLALAFSPNFSLDETLTVVTINGTGTYFEACKLTATPEWNNPAGFVNYPVAIQNEGVDITDATAASISLAPTYLGGDEVERVAFVGIMATTLSNAGIYRLDDYVDKTILTGKQIHSVAYDGAVLVAGSEHSTTVWRSADPMAPTPTFSSSVAGPGGENKVVVAWAGVDVIAGTSGNGSAFAVSTDNGENFNDMSLIDIAGMAPGLAVTLAEGSTIITASKDGITSNEAILAITSPAVPPAPTPSLHTGGGSGGGGGGGSVGYTNVNEYINSQDVFTHNVVAESADGKVRLHITKGTVGLNRVRQPLYYVSIKEKNSPAEPPAYCQIIGLVYDFGPDGATFEPPITLTFIYDASEIPEGVLEHNLVVAKWDKSTEEWVDLESIVEPETHTVSTKIGQLSIYTVIAPAHPAIFTMADLSVTPKEVNIGESLSISTLITNTSGFIGSYEVNLKINNVVVQTKEVRLAGGDSETISFNVTPDTVGEHTVNISGLMGTFDVGELKVAPEPTPTPAPTVAPAPASFTTSDLSVTSSEVKPSEQVTISAMVTNTGGSAGSHIVVLKIDGVEEAKKEVTVGAGNSESVSFTIAKETEGIYTVDIDGNVGRFTVIVPTPPTPKPVGELPVRPPTNWWLIGGIIAGCVIVAAGLLVYHLLWRKRGAQRPS